MRRNPIINIICFSLAAALAVTFITAAGTAALAGHCGKVNIDDPISVVRSVLERRAANAESESETEGEDVRAIAEADEMAEDEDRLTVVTAQIALIFLCAAIVAATALYVIGRRKR